MQMCHHRFPGLSRIHFRFDHLLMRTCYTFNLKKNRKLNEETTKVHEYKTNKMLLHFIIVLENTQPK